MIFKRYCGEGGYAYVDKTEVIYRLTQSGKYFFLSRPRRFGKSLMLSTIEAYFEGRKDLFEGLWLGQAEGVDWTPRPVFRLNFVSAKADVKDVEITIADHLKKWETIYNVDTTEIPDSLGRRFFNVIEKAYKVTGQKVVVLIDEYDKVLVNTMHDVDLHEVMKKVLKPVFGTLKGADAFIEFAILTGVSRFAKLSLFSDINNLQDISFDSRFATICGITEDEITRYFREGVADFAKIRGVSFDEMLKILKYHYDGYHFARYCPDIYNPFSLINALSSGEITHRWFESGTPTFLTKWVQSINEPISQVFTPLVDDDTLFGMTAYDGSLTSMLYQTGYLTLKYFDEDYEAFQLGIPNREVETGLYKYLLPLYSGKDIVTNNTNLIHLRRALVTGEVDKFMKILKSLLGAVPYHLTEDKSEIYYENNIHLIFLLLGLKSRPEYMTSDGRIDIVLETPKYNYIFELKLNGTAEDALQQILEKRYDLPFLMEDKALIRVGVGFSKTTRTVDNWIWIDSTGARH